MKGKQTVAPNQNSWKAIHAVVETAKSKIVIEKSGCSEMYHYTTRSCLESIVTRNGIKLWFSDMHCLNDAFEQKEGIRIFKEVCDKERNDPQLITDSSFLDDIYDLQEAEGYCVYENSETGEIVVNGDRQSTNYVCCFSESESSLPMWNYYSKGGHHEGCNIGISPFEALESLGKLFGSGISFFLIRVVYDDEKKREIITDALVHLFTIYQAYGKKNKFEIIHAIRILLRYWTWAFKGVDFEHEHEVRLIIAAPQKPSTIKTAKEQPPLRIRSKNGFMTTYYEVVLDHDVINSIKLGPSVSSNDDKRMQENIVRTYISYNGYKEERIEISTAKITSRF